MASKSIPGWETPKDANNWVSSESLAWGLAAWHLVQALVTLVSADGNG